MVQPWRRGNSGGSRRGRGGDRESPRKKRLPARITQRPVRPGSVMEPAFILITNRCQTVEEGFQAGGRPAPAPLPPRFETTLPFPRTRLVERTRASHMPWLGTHHALTMTDHAHDFQLSVGILSSDLVQSMRDTPAAGCRRSGGGQESGSLRVWEFESLRVWGWSGRNSVMGPLLQPSIHSLIQHPIPAP
jgi:hypothetical protein